MTTPGDKPQVLKEVEAIRATMRKAIDDSGMSQEQIGIKMGFSKDSARQAVSRLLNASEYNPRLSTLVAFAKAVGRPLRELV